MFCNCIANRSQTFAQGLSLSVSTFDETIYCGQCSKGPWAFCHKWWVCCNHQDDDEGMMPETLSRKSKVKLQSKLQTLLIQIPLKCNCCLTAYICIRKLKLTRWLKLVLLHFSKIFLESIWLETRNFLSAWNSEHTIDKIEIDRNVLSGVRWLKKFSNLSNIIYSVNLCFSTITFFSPTFLSVSSMSCSICLINLCHFFYRILNVSLCVFVSLYAFLFSLFFSWLTLNASFCLCMHFCLYLCQLWLSLEMRNENPSISS